MNTITWSRLLIRRYTLDIVVMHVWPVITLCVISIVTNSSGSKPARMVRRVWYALVIRTCEIVPTIRNDARPFERVITVTRKKAN